MPSQFDTNNIQNFCFGCGKTLAPPCTPTDRDRPPHLNLFFCRCHVHPTSPVQLCENGTAGGGTTDMGDGRHKSSEQLAVRQTEHEGWDCASSEIDTESDLDITGVNDAKVPMLDVNDMGFHDPRDVDRLVRRSERRETHLAFHDSEPRMEDSMHVHTWATNSPSDSICFESASSSGSEDSSGFLPSPSESEMLGFVGGGAVSPPEEFPDFDM